MKTFINECISFEFNPYSYKEKKYDSNIKKILDFFTRVKSLMATCENLVHLWYELKINTKKGYSTGIREA